jgi:hypothetical protein
MRKCRNCNRLEYISIYVDEEAEDPNVETKENPHIHVE